MKLAQLKGMIYYELMILWRRRVLPIVMVGTLILIVGMTQILISPLQTAQDAEGAQIAATELAMTPEEIEYWQTTFLTTFIIGFTTMSVLISVLAGAIPMIMAERIPYDRQYGVRELLDSLPLGQGTYLTGKLLGTWTALLLGLTSVMLTGGLLNWLLFGPYLVGGYLLTFITLLPLALFTAGVSIMLAAGQPNRRRAVLVGFMVIIYLLVNFNTEFDSWSWKGLISPLQPVYMDLQFHFLEQSISDVSGEVISSHHPSVQPRPQSVPLRLQIITALVPLQLALGWLITWRWMCWREGR